jgi:hypothetical protein
LVAQSGLELEHPTVSALYQAIVLDGDWPKAETLLVSAASAGLFDDYIQFSQPSPFWKQMHGTNRDGDKPPSRTSPMMCLDSDRQLLYVLGGWDGQQHFADFWVYLIQQDQWKTISLNTAESGGPGPIAGQDILFDRNTGDIYILSAGFREASNGSAIVSPTSADIATPPSPDPPSGEAGQLQSLSSIPPAPIEFYRYKTKGPEEGQWIMISADTAVSVISCMAINLSYGTTRQMVAQQIVMLGTQ